MKAHFVRRSWRGSNPRRPPSREQSMSALTTRPRSASNILIISKDETVIWISIHCINEPLWQERKQDIMIRCKPRSMCPVPWRMRLLMPCGISTLDVFQPAWLDETYRPKLRQIGRSRWRVGALVLPHVNRPVRTIDLSERIMSIMTIILNNANNCYNQDN